MCLLLNMAIVIVWMFVQKLGPRESNSFVRFEKPGSSASLFGEAVVRSAFPKSTLTVR